MKKLIVKVTEMKVVFAVLFLGLAFSLNAQSKADLVKEFEQLNEKSFEIYEKYDEKFDALDTKWINEELDDDNFEDFDFSEEEIMDEFDNEPFKPEEEMTAYVADYEDRFPNTTLDEVIKTIQAERKTALAHAENEMDKDYMNLSFDIELDTAKIQHKMYLIAKAFLKK